MKSNCMRFFGLLLSFVLLFSLNVSAQDKDENPFKMTPVKILKTTSVKNQGGTSTCWSFGTTSMIESELIRLGKGEFDLSEMYTVRNTYNNKATDYIRWHGNTTFAPGGAQHDVTNMWKKYGMVPDEAYSGLKKGVSLHNHGAMHKILDGFIQLVLESNGKFPHWQHSFSQLTDSYLSKNPRKFNYEGEEYTPKTFAEMLEINPDDYIEFSSYTHHPFYEKFALEVPDNWAHNTVYNVPIDELMEIMEYSIMKGYSISWAADISSLNFAKGVAMVPADDKQEIKPGIEEKEITQKIRQQNFDAWTLTDDHCMHIMGIAKDQNGKKYFKEKNSWGVRGVYEGYSYMSYEWMRLRTMSIMVHKDAIPEEIARKIGMIHGH
ncbi:C1 family peptidase [Bacteroidota bacterium]